jgi:hypothetical protein
MSATESAHRANPTPKVTNPEPGSRKVPISTRRDSHINNSESPKKKMPLLRSRAISQTYWDVPVPLFPKEGDGEIRVGLRATQALAPRVRAVNIIPPDLPLEKGGEKGICSI